MTAASGGAKALSSCKSVMFVCFLTVQAKAFMRTGASGPRLQVTWLMTKFCQQATEDVEVRIPGEQAEHELSARAHQLAGYLDE